MGKNNIKNKLGIYRNVEHKYHLNMEESLHETRHYLGGNSEEFLEASGLLRKYTTIEHKNSTETYRTDRVSIKRHELKFDDEMQSRYRDIIVVEYNKKQLAYISTMPGEKDILAISLAGFTDLVQCWKPNTLQTYCGILAGALNGISKRFMWQVNACWDKEHCQACVVSVEYYKNPDRFTQEVPIVEHYTLVTSSGRICTVPVIRVAFLQHILFGTLRCISDTQKEYLKTEAPDLTPLAPMQLALNRHAKVVEREREVPFGYKENLTALLPPTTWLKKQEWPIPDDMCLVMAIPIDVVNGKDVIQIHKRHFYVDYYKNILTYSTYGKWSNGSPGRVYDLIEAIQAGWIATGIFPEIVSRRMIPAKEKNNA